MDSQLKYNLEVSGVFLGFFVFCRARSSKQGLPGKLQKALLTDWMDVQYLDHVIAVAMAGEGPPCPGDHRDFCSLLTAVHTA